MKIARFLAITVAAWLLFVTIASSAEQVSCHLVGTRTAESVHLNLSNVVCDFSGTAASATRSEESSSRRIPVAMGTSTPSQASLRTYNQSTPIQLMYSQPPVGSYFVPRVEGTWVVKRGQSIASVLGSNTEAKRAMDNMNIRYTSDGRFSLKPSTPTPVGFEFARYSTVIGNTTYIWYAQRTGY